MPKLSVYIIRAALLQLGVGFTLGAMLLWNKGMPFNPQVWRLLGAHVELLIFGWMAQLAMGVAFFALPRHSNHDHRYGRVWMGWLSFVLLNAGVFISAYARWLGANNLVLGGHALLLLSAITFALLINPRVKPFGVHT